jgi:RNA polymerase sigma factor (sigma-70 family)
VKSETTAEASALLTANLDVVERAIAFAVRRYGFDVDDAEELAGIVRLRLVENDYAVIRTFEERSSFATFISVVVQRLALDYRIQVWGKWHASAEAKRLGPAALELDRLLHRDGRGLDEAIAIVAANHRGESLEALRALAERLPPHPPRRRSVALDEVDEGVASRPADVDSVLAGERRRTSERLSTIMSAVIEELPEDDRLILQLRFEGGMTVPQIARSLGLDQKLTYRRIERNMRQMKRELEGSGLGPEDALDLIGRDEVLLRFDLGKPAGRPSIPVDEMATDKREESR